MLHIYRDGIHRTVTVGAFNTIYRPLGFMVKNAQYGVGTSEGVIYPYKEEDHEIAQNLTENSSDIDLTEETEGEDALDETSAVEKPLSEMSFSELLEFADSLGIDTEGARSKEELRKLIKANK